MVTVFTGDGHKNHGSADKVTNQTVAALHSGCRPQAVKSESWQLTTLEHAEPKGDWLPYLEI
jgi:hypothetical protein